VWSQKEIQNKNKNTQWLFLKINTWPTLVLMVLHEMVHPRLKGTKVTVDCFLELNPSPHFTWSWTLMITLLFSQCTGGMTTGLGNTTIGFMHGPNNFLSSVGSFQDCMKCMSCISAPLLRGKWNCWGYELVFKVLGLDVLQIHVLTLYE
jgi:hypothetical protein